MEHPSSRQEQPRWCWNGKTTPGPAPQTRQQCCWSQEGLVRAGLWCVPGSGACRALVHAEVCAGSQAAEQ